MAQEQGFTLSKHLQLTVHRNLHQQRVDCLQSKVQRTATCIQLPRWLLSLMVEQSAQTLRLT